jgi:hypothetical protein
VEATLFAETLAAVSRLATALAQTAILTVIVIGTMPMAPANFLTIGKEGNADRLLFLYFDFL